MKELVATACNIFYTQDADGKLTPHTEMILVVSEPEYTARRKDNWQIRRRTIPCHEEATNSK